MAATKPPQAVHGGMVRLEMTERAAFIKGMAEALRLETGDDRDRLLSEIARAFSAIAEEIEEINQELDQIALNEMEGGHLIAVRCSGCGEELAVDEELLNDPAVEITCPSCGEDLSGRAQEGKRGQEGGRVRNHHGAERMQ